ncbi:helix-turn-helix transcriptional regulator [Fulvivirga sediminis]|uniref:YafY family transcriptional regulator n=1 Tax=Fulvivirga sediminis TaxID=2803949 RepID=A0A937FAX3_9BACT|nr:YafY family protein [Fulvivirga sediminis]MBL3657123.1 YafY family transcriptional regulator [Fulvivirga sediminis]
MAKDKPRLARLTAIITQLQSKRLVTARDIADKHNISIRTVYRDIRTLEQSGIPVITEEGRGYTIMKGYNLPPIMFSEEEANALITAEQIIRNNPDQSLIKAYKSATEKIRSTMRYTQKEKVDLLSRRLQVRNYNLDNPGSDHLIKIQTAIIEYRLVSIKYHSLQNKSTERQIEPFALVQTQENWVLIAHCRLREDFRSFRLDCIKELKVHDETFDPHDISLEKYFEELSKKWTNP